MLHSPLCILFGTIISRLQQLKSICFMRQHASPAVPYCIESTRLTKKWSLIACVLPCFVFNYYLNVLRKVSKSEYLPFNLQNVIWFWLQSTVQMLCQKLSIPPSAPIFLSLRNKNAGREVKHCHVTWVFLWLHGKCVKQFCILIPFLIWFC